MKRLPILTYTKERRLLFLALEAPSATEQTETTEEQSQEERDTPTTPEDLQTPEGGVDDDKVQNQVRSEREKANQNIADNQQRAAGTKERAQQIREQLGLPKNQAEESGQQSEESEREQPLSEQEIKTLAQSFLGVDTIDPTQWPDVKYRLFGNAEFVRDSRGLLIKNMGGAARELADNSGGVLAINEETQRILRTRVGLEQKEDIEKVPEQDVQALMEATLGLSMKELQQSGGDYQTVRQKLFGNAEFYVNRSDPRGGMIIYNMGGALHDLINQTLQETRSNRFVSTEGTQRELRRRVGVEKKEDKQQLTASQLQSRAKETVGAPVKSADLPNIFGRNVKFYQDQQGKITFESLGGFVGEIKKVSDGVYAMLSLSKAQQAQVQEKLGYEQRG